MRKPNHLRPNERLGLRAVRAKTQVALAATDTSATNMHLAQSRWAVRAIEKARFGLTASPRVSKQSRPENI